MGELSGEQVEALAERLRRYLRLYTLPANVGRYVSAKDSHDTVAQRCGPILAEDLAHTVAAMLADARAEVVRDVEAVLPPPGAVLQSRDGDAIRAVLARHTSAAAGAPPEPSQVSSGAEVHPDSARPSDGRTEPQGPSGGRRSLCGERLGFMRCQLKRGHDGQHEDWSGV